MTSIYYNEWEKYPAEWLRNLMLTGEIPQGDVDETDIRKIKAEDIQEYGVCHFFAGIAGWPLALKLAGWGPARNVWTGSCPCQSFSQAGQRKGFDDERDLWPAWFKLIKQHRPVTIFGEQVEGAIRFGWLDRIYADLENEGYAVGAAVLGAHSVGAPHVRQRLYWVAHAHGAEQYGGRASGGKQSIRFGMHESNERLANAGYEQSGRRAGRSEATSRWTRGDVTGSSPGFEGLGNAASARLQGQRSEYSPSGERCSGLLGFAMQAGVPQWNGPTVALECADGYRRASSQSNAFPVAHGVPKRMGKLRGSGNAIVPQVAVTFIKAFLQAETEL